MEAANHGLSRGTWASYSSAFKALQKFAAEKNETLSFPLSQKQILAFIAFLANRNLSAKTINVYLAGIRQYHLVAGVELPTIRSPIVNLIIEGKKHQDILHKKTQGDKSRLPMTPTMMLLLKEELRINRTLDDKDKLLIWAVATLAFNGAFRIHELLARKTSSFDPKFSLLGRDVSLKSVPIGKEKVEAIQVLIKSEKKDRVGAGIKVDVYESKGPLCPVNAYKKWLKKTGYTPAKKPAFLFASGKPLTGKTMNSLLKKFLNKHLQSTKRKITSHSFRGGIASLMGELGYSDSDIMAIGRWSSRSFEAYLKLPRTKRVEMARKLGKLGL